MDKPGIQWSRPGTETPCQGTVPIERTVGQENHVPGVGGMVHPCTGCVWAGYRDEQFGCVFTNSIVIGRCEKFTTT
jgi:hypothetical protein